MEFLKNLWSGIQKKYKNAARALTDSHQELDIRLRAVRDLLMHEAETLIIDSRSGYQEILSFLDTFMPSLKSSVELYEGKEPILDAYNLRRGYIQGPKEKGMAQVGRLYRHRTHRSAGGHRRQYRTVCGQTQP